MGLPVGFGKPLGGSEHRTQPSRASQGREGHVNVMSGDGEQARTNGVAQERVCVLLVIAPAIIK